MLAASSKWGVDELAREYQDYVIAHRVRVLLGGRLRPQALLPLSAYASLRLQRQRLAESLVRDKPLGFAKLQALDQLSDALCFGLWHNPSEINQFLAAVVRVGGHAVFESEDIFANTLLLVHERAVLPDRGLEVARYHHACLRVGAASLHLQEMELASERVLRLAQRVPLYMAEFR